MAETKWAFNLDTARVESRRPDGSVIAIDTLAVEREFVETWLDRRELDYLIYNDPDAYAELVLAERVLGYGETGTIDCRRAGHTIPPFSCFIVSSQEAGRFSGFDPLYLIQT